MKSDCFWIWSFEHDAWWAPERNGYVKDRSKAGVYLYQEALELCRNGNMGGRIDEAIVPVINELEDREK